MSSTARSRGVRRALALTVTWEVAVTLAVLAAQSVAILAYVAATGTQLLSVGATLYPVVWITLSVYFVLFLHRYGPRITASPLAVVVGVGYFLVLATLAGLFWPLPGVFGAGHEMAGGARFIWAVPGWGPVYLYGGSLVQVALVPFKVIGYAALATGIAAAVAASTRGALAGLVGLFSCVGCVLPLLAVVSGVFGSASTLVATMGGSYPVGTAVFVVTLAVLAVSIPTTDPAAGTP